MTIARPVRTAPGAERESQGLRQPRRSPIRLAAAAILVALASSAIACLALGSLVPVFLIAVLAAAVAIRPQHPTLGLGYAVLVATTALVLLSIIPVRLGGGAPWRLVAASLTVAIAASVWRAAGDVGAVRRGLASTSPAVLVGPVVLIGSVLVFAALRGPNPAWAMSGDSRNHVLMTEAISAAGGWTFLTDYPAAANALASLMALPRSTGLRGTDLMLQVQVSSQALVAVLLLLGLLAGGICSSGLRGTAGMIRAGAGSALSVSPLLLGAVLIGGYHPIPLAVLILAATAAVLALEARGWRRGLVWAGAGSVLLLLTFPTVAPLAPAALIGRQVAVAGRTRMPALATAGIGLLILFGSLWVLGNRAGLVAILSAEGGIAPRSPLLLVAVLGIAVVSWLLNRSRSQLGIAAAVMGALVALAVIVAWLWQLSGEYSYYAEKTLWVGSTALLALAAAHSPEPQDSPASIPPRGAAIAPALLLIVVSWIPLFFRPGGVPVPAISIAQGWAEPSAANVSLLQRLPDERPHNYVWRIDPVEDPRLNNWLSSWNVPIGDLDFSQPAMSWTYSAAAGSATTFCFLMAAQPDSIVWTDEAADAVRLRRTCDTGRDRVRVLPSWQ